MKRDTIGNKFNSNFTVELPAKKYMAVRITKSDLMFPIKNPDYLPKGSLLLTVFVLTSCNSKKVNSPLNR